MGTSFPTTVQRWSIPKTLRTCLNDVHFLCAVFLVPVRRGCREVRNLFGNWRVEVRNKTYLKIIKKKGFSGRKWTVIDLYGRKGVRFYWSRVQPRVTRPRTRGPRRCVGVVVLYESRRCRNALQNRCHV